MRSLRFKKSMEDGMSKLTINQIVDADWKEICKIGGIAVIIQLICVIITLIVIIVLGGEPTTVEEYFSLLQTNRLMGLLRMDFSSMVSVALYPLTFFGLYAALRSVNGAIMSLITAFGFAGVILWLGSHSAFSMLTLSDQYAAALTESQQAQILAAGQVIIASDMWHSTGAIIGGIFTQSALVAVSILMLPGNVFSKTTSIVGILTHGLDLAHILIGIFAPGIGIWLMFVAGPLYPLWFILIAIRLFKLSRYNHFNQ